MDNKMLKLLHESFNRELSESENQRLTHALKNDPEFKEEASGLRKVRDMIGNQEYTFGPYFTEKVMSGIGERAETALMTAFNRIALPGLVAAVILLLISFWGGDNFSFDAILGVDNLKPEYLSDFLIYNH